MFRPQPITKKGEELKPGDTIFYYNRWEKIQRILPGTSGRWMFIHLGEKNAGPVIQRHELDDIVVGFEGS